MIVFSISLVECCSVHAASSASMSGEVVDALSDQPIVNATIAVWEFVDQRRRIGRSWITERVNERFVQSVSTDLNGEYAISVPAESGSRYSYHGYAYYDDPRTPGSDYLPGVSLLSVSVTQYVTFRLHPAATIVVSDILFVDSPQPPSAYSFVPVYPIGDLTAFHYGTDVETITRFIEGEPTHVLVRANQSCYIRLLASTTTEHRLDFDDPQFATLSQGGQLQISLFDHSLPYNLNLTTAILSRAATRISDAEHHDVCAEMERRDIDAALLLIDHAQEQMLLGRPAESYADLRQAYTLVGFIIEKLVRMFQDAVSSTIFIILFFTFTASALSHLLVDHWAQKVLVLSVFYAFFLVVLSQIYVGIRLVEFTMLLLLVTGAWSGVTFITVLAPRLLKSTTSAIFAMAKRNLRGRRFRVLSTLFTVMMFVMAFVAFTSVSTEYGFTTSTSVIETASEGIVVRQPTPHWAAQIPQEHVQTQRVSSFLPFSTTILDWLHRKPDVNQVAPKVENWPSRRSIGSMGNSDERVALYGVVGILPSTEAEMTHLDALVIEGRYLRDDEYDAVLISTTTAATLHLSVGDSVQLQIGVPRSMTVVGLIDDEGFRQQRDIDGSLMLPQKLYMYTDVDILISWWLEPCTPSEAIIVHWQTALQLSQYTAEDVSQLELADLQSTPILISRLNVDASESVDLLAFARQLALESEYWVWATLGTRVHFFALKQFVEVKGFLVLIPWMIVVLNVAITMINSIYQRRRDIHILASVGLNPTHLASLFGVEALLIGGIGGSLGYLMGLSLYKIMLLLSLDLAVQQKISAVWSLAALGIAVIAVGVGMLMAMRLSTIITPSLLRRWQARSQSRAGEWVYPLPVKVSVEDVESMLTYIHRLLKSYEQAPDVWVDRLIRDDAGIATNLPKRIVFTCHHGRGINHYLSRNQIAASKGTDDEVYLVKLVSSRTTAANANTTARFVRQLFLMWSVRTK